MKSSSHPVLAYLRDLVARHDTATEEDGELLRRLVEGRDEEAFTVLLQRHGPMVLSLARRVTGDEQTAEDVFQAAFLWLFRKGHTIRRPQSLSCWLHGVAHRLALQARRAQERRHHREALVRPSPPHNPLDELTAQEFLAVLDEELAKLPEKYRAPLILCCLEGLSQEEASKRLGCSAGAVKGRLERGRNQLRQRLEKRGLTLPAVLGGTLLLAGSTSPVPAALVQTTLQAAKTGGIAPTVAALLKEAMRTMLVNKLKAIGAAVVLLVLSGTGVGMMAFRPQDIERDAPPTAPNSTDNAVSAENRVDLYGDPLPEGAVMRLGTLKRRAIDMQLAVTADGKSIVGARHALCLSIWDAATGELRQKRELPESWGTSVLSPDGRWLAQGCLAEHPLVIWDVQTVEKYRVLGTEEKRKFWPIAFSRDSKSVAAIGSRQDNKGGYDHLLRVWDLAGGKEIFSAEIHHKHSGHRLALSPDGNWLLASFYDGPHDKGLYCWNIAAGRQAWLNEDTIGANSLVPTADDKILTSPNGKILDLTTGQTVEPEKPPPIYNSWSLTLTPDGRTLLISAKQGVIVWDMIRGQQLRMLPVAVTNFVVMPDGKSIITNNGSLQRWDLETGKPLWRDTFALGHIGYVDALAFSVDGKRLASMSQDGSVRLWDAVTGRPLRVWRGHDSSRPWYWGFVQALDITPDGRWILSPGDEKDLKLWDASSEKVARLLALPPRESDRGYGNSPVLQVRFSADGSRAVGLLRHPGQTHQLATWDLKTGQLLACHSVEQTQEGFQALSADGRVLLCNGVLVDTASGTKMGRLEGTSTAPYSFSRDGALVCGGSTRTMQKDGKTQQTADGLRIWESATGKTVAHLPSKPRAYQAVFHPNNRLLVTNNNDGIQFHDVLTGKLLAVRRMPKDVLSEGTRFNITADGRRLATGMLDGTILLWDISLPVSKPQHLEAKEIESLWTDLADADAAKAWRAVWRMAEAPQDALAFLRPRVKPDPTAPAEVTRKLLADLDSDAFEVREAAVKRLQELGPQAEPALRAALKDKPSLEQRRRIEELLSDLTKALPPPTAEELRQLRALIVLERIGSPEARRLLAEVSKGPESTRRTRQAKAALVCLP